MKISKKLIHLGAIFVFFIIIMVINMNKVNATTKCFIMPFDESTRNKANIMFKFGETRSLGSNPHGGTDIYVEGIDTQVQLDQTSIAVCAPASGVIDSIDTDKGGNTTGELNGKTYTTGTGNGNIVRIECEANSDGDKLFVSIIHLKSIAVTKGQQVKQGDIIGYMGVTRSFLGKHSTRW